MIASADEVIADDSTFTDVNAGFPPSSPIPRPGREKALRGMSATSALAPRGTAPLRRFRAFACHVRMNQAYPQRTCAAANA